MELDWRNRCVGGERLEDLCNVVGDLGATDVEELYDLLWDDVETALPFHRALLRVWAELLWQRAARLRPANVPCPYGDHDRGPHEAFHEVLRRAGIELGRAGPVSPPDPTHYVKSESDVTWPG
jgi:hypothetical protein